MNNTIKEINNCIILLMGLPGAGKQTIGEVLTKKAGIRLVSEWVVPILKLFGDNYRVMWDLDAAGWEKMNAADDLILSTIADACPKENSYVITQMMFDHDPYHQAFYEKVLATTEKRNAFFLPVRLVCAEDELVKRVQSKERKKYQFKTMDAELARRYSREKEVFYSRHPNEITIDNSEKTPDEVATIIIDHVIKISEQKHSK